MFHFWMLLFICPVDKDLNWNIVCWRHQNCWALTNVECNWHSNSWVLSIFLPFEKSWLERFYEIDSLQMLSARRLGKVTTRWKSLDFPQVGILETRSRSIWKNPAFENKIPRKNLDCISFVLKEFVLSDTLLKRNAWIVDSCLFCLFVYSPAQMGRCYIDVKPLWNKGDQDRVRHQNE